MTRGSSAWVNPASARGKRIGTVRRPPRGVRKERYAPDDWFDVWYPDLAPSAELMAQGNSAVTETEWKRFVRAFKAEMDVPTARNGHAQSVGSALAWHQLIDRLLLRERIPAATGLCFANYSKGRGASLGSRGPTAELSSPTVRIQHP